MIGYRIKLANHYAVGGRRELTARGEDRKVLTLASKEDAYAVAREDDPYDYDVYEVNVPASQINADRDTALMRGQWTAWEDGEL